MRDKPSDDGGTPLCRQPAAQCLSTQHDTNEHFNESNKQRLMGTQIDMEHTGVTSNPFTHFAN